MITRVLVPLDGSPLGELALPHAAALADVCDASVTLFRAIEPARPRDFSSVAIESRLQAAEARSYLEEHARDLLSRGIRARMEVREGPAAAKICEFVREAGIDLVALCTHGETGVGSLPMGSVAWKVIADGATSVLLVRAAGRRDAPADYGTVMVPVDGSPQSECALHFAAKVARARGAELLVVQAVPVPEMTRRLPPSPRDREIRRALVRANRRAARANLRECRARLDCPDLVVRTRVVVTRRVAESLHRFAASEGVGLIVASAHGSSGPSRSVYGSVASHLVDYGETPVLILQDAPRRRREPCPAALAEVRTRPRAARKPIEAELTAGGNGVGA